MSDIAITYLRQKATTMRNRLNDPKRDLSEDARDELVIGSRHLEIAADEIEADFHVKDEEE